MLASAGSFLDGGANAPLQKLALPLMDMDFIRRDTWALQRHFKKKRDFILHELTSLGITVQLTPTATFYIWADLSGLPRPLGAFVQQFTSELASHFNFWLYWSHPLLMLFLLTRKRRLFSVS